MKRLKKAVAVLGLALAGAAAAQGFGLEDRGPQVSAYGVFSNSAVGFGFGAGFPNFTTLFDNSVTGRLNLDMGVGYTALSANALLVFPLAEEALNVYAGAGVGVLLGGRLTTGGLYPVFTAGVSMPLAEQLDVYAEGAFRINAPTALRLGISYQF